jgi:heme a synthase
MQIATAEQQTAMIRWLWLVAGLVFAIVIVGGATRLTDSGLSITEWKPVTGILPPLSEAAWLAELEKYRGTTEYEMINKGFGMAEFQVIYYWEWGHRLLGRVIGLAFLAGLLWFWAKGRLTSGLKGTLVVIFGLICLQGAVGWWMVASGLTDRVDVAPYRLATHLTLACIILASLIWVATGLKRRSLAPVSGGQAAFAVGLMLAILTQVFLGALVAGNKAGLVYNTWPLIDGYVIPPAGDLLFSKPAWVNFFENHLLVQFNHRLMAYALVVAAILHAVQMRSIKGHGFWAMKLAVLMLGQAALGIVTLLLVAPVWAALAHQAYAALLLALATLHARRMVAARQHSYPVQAAAARA